MSTMTRIVELRKKLIVDNSVAMIQRRSGCLDPGVAFFSFTLAVGAAASLPLSDGWGVRTMIAASNVIKASAQPITREAILCS